ncbi:TonB-dependent receptor [bacterium]|nr:TonB-dependent receptor [bacterium]
MRINFRLLATWTLLGATLLAQNLGRLEVKVVRGDSGVPLADVRVLLTDRDGASRAVELKTGAGGEVIFPNLEPGEYIVELHHPVYGGESSVVKVEVDKPTVFRTALDPSDDSTFSVRDSRQLIDTKSPTEGSVTTRDRDFLDRQLAEKSVQGVLTTVPGTQRNSLGQTHVRGEHKSVTFALDGVAVPISQASTTSQPIDPEFLQQVSVRTGTMDGSQGGQTGMVLDAQTPDDVEPFFEAQTKVGNLGQIENVLKAGGRNDQGNFSFFLGGRIGQTNLQFEPPQAQQQTLNNRGVTQSYMMRMTGRNESDQLSGTLSYQLNEFQLPQTTLNYGAGVRQDQVDSNTMALLSWKRKWDEDSDLLLSMSYLKSSQLVRNNGIFTPWTGFNPNVSTDLADGGLPADPENPGSPYLPLSDLTIEQFQPAITYFLRLGEGSKITAGVTADFIKSNQAVNLLDPGGGGGLPQGQPQFASAIRRNGLTTGAFFNHTMPLSDQWTLNYGLRAETFNNGLDVSTGQLSPLVNLAWAPNDRNVLRISYNRSFQAPPLELDVSGQTTVLPQRLSTYEISYESQLSDTFTAKLAAVRKDYKDQVDIGLLIPNSNVPIYAPVNFGTARYEGVELSLNTHNPTGFNGFLAGTVSVARPLSPGAFATVVTEYNDHDQRLQVTGGLSYLFDNGLSMAVDGYYGSGFPQPAIPQYQAVGIDPYGLLQERVPRLLANLNFTYRPEPTPDGPDVSGGLQILNLFDTRPLLNFYSAFSGTRFVQQRRVLLNASIRF